jgi:hypothetical protein
MVERPVYEYYLFYNKWIADRRKEISRSKAQARK